MELICIGFLAGMLVAFVIFAWSVVFDDKHDKGKFDDDRDIRVYVPVRDRDRSRNNRLDISDEELATILRTICVTGICPSRNEKEYLQEAAERLEKRIEDDGR